MYNGEYRFLNNAELAAHQGETGAFIQLGTDSTYSENQLAGPWAALNFMRYLRAHDSRVYFALLKQVSSDLAPDRPNVAGEMQKLLDLDYSYVTQWAKEAPSDIIRSINNKVPHQSLSKRMSFSSE